MRFEKLESRELKRKLNIDRLEDRRLLAVLIGQVDFDASVPGPEAVVADNLPAGMDLGNGLVTTHDDLDPAADVATMEGQGWRLEAYTVGNFAGWHWQSVNVDGTPGAYLREQPHVVDEVLVMEVDWNADGIADAIVADELPAGSAVEYEGQVVTTTHSDRAFGLDNFILFYDYVDNNFRMAMLVDADGDLSTDTDRLSASYNASVLDSGAGVF